MTSVLDSWAMLAWLQDERPASTTVQGLLDDADRGLRELHLSLLNLGEVLYIVGRRTSWKEALGVRDRLQAAPLAIDGVDEDLVWNAARLKATHRVAYADAFAAALALRLHCEVVTGDPEFESLEATEGLDVRWLRRSVG